MVKKLRSLLIIMTLTFSSWTFAQDAELCAPSGLNVFAGDSENIISWVEPVGNVGCGDIGISSLPFMDQNTNIGQGNDWDVSGGDNEDVAYTFNVGTTITIDVDLCSDFTDYDTKLEIFTADMSCIATSTGNYNDDGPWGTCPESPAPYTPSFLGNVTLTPGQYYIVVDGFGTASGNYEINVTESTGRSEVANVHDVLDAEAAKMLALGSSQAEVDAMMQEARDHFSNATSSREIPPECGTFVSYKIYNGNDGSLVAEVTDGLSYTHSGLTNGTEYCYYVTTSYSEGESASTDTVCGTPDTFTPAPPTNAAVIVGDEQLTLTWTAPDVMQLGIGYVETFDGALTDLWTWEEGGNWRISTTRGNPLPSAEFYWSPSLDDYSYSLYSPMIPLGSETTADLVYDFQLDDYGATGLEHLAFEYLANGVWVTAADYSNTADITWASYTHTMTGLSGSTQIRVRAYGSDSFEINWWNVDNIGIVASTTGREITNSTISVIDDYISGATLDITFQIDYESSDLDYLDGASLTFPAGFTVNSATDAGGLVYNGEAGDGATVTWGDNANDQMGEQYQDVQFDVNVTVASGISGPQSIAWSLSGDTYGSDPHDVSGTMTIDESTYLEYDFMGYSVYLDGVLQTATPITATQYLFTGLTNLTDYTLGVASRHFPDYESEIVTVVAAPQYLFGDITGIISDPNGDPLDSAVVTAGGLSDTTGADGAYTLWNLIPGSYTVKAQRVGFEYSEAEVIVIAQADPIVQNLVLQPALARAQGVVAIAGDSEVFLTWRMPGGETDYDLAYYDDFFEAQIGCGGGCEFGVRFTPAGYPAALTNLFISVQGDAATTNANIVAFLDPAGSVTGPSGTPVVLASGLDLSSPDGSLTQYSIDVSDAGLEITSGDVYIMIQENSSGFMGIANDLDPQSPEFYDRNWVYVGGVYSTIYDAVAGDPTLTGDFGLMGTFFGAAGRSVTMNDNNEEVTAPGNAIPLVARGTLTQNYRGETNRSVGTNPDFVKQLSEIHTPNLPQDYSREDSLVGFKVYHITDDGDTLVAVTDGDTTATVSVPVNYVEYCYNVTAMWATENYGTLESKPSSAACTVPYTAGDADFDSDVDLTDLLAVVDFVLEVTTPTPDQFRNTDINKDNTINIADIVMVVDIIYGGTGRMLAFNSDELAELELLGVDGNTLNLNLTYDGMVRGMQFTIQYNPARMAIRMPQLIQAQDQVMISVNEAIPGNLNVIVLNMAGGVLDNPNESLLRIPVEFKGSSQEAVQVTLKNSTLAGPNGELIPVAERSSGFDANVLPNQFALHQNYPNPFNPTTEIRFDIAELSPVKVVVYNLMGQKIRTLVNQDMKPGFHSIVWNGNNDKGMPVASGMYFYTLDAKSFHSMKKMVLLK